MKNIYTCWVPADGATPEDGRDVEAYDGADAAERFVEMREAKNCDYAVLNGETIIVAVALDGGEPVSYSVWGEPRPLYHASRVR